MDLVVLWVLLQVVGLNLVLSADNAVVIALAARSLPRRQQTLAVLYGTSGAMALRIALTIAAVELLKIPYLKLVGAALLLWIAVKLLLPGEREPDAIAPSMSLSSAVKTILVADVMMSLDNVLAIAAAAKDNLALVVIGLTLSIPIIAFGSAILVRMMERWPVIIVIGAALIGWVAGELAVGDPGIRDSIDAAAQWLRWASPAAGAVFVVVVGKRLAVRPLVK